MRGNQQLVPRSLKSFGWLRGAGGSWQLMGTNPAHADVLQILVSPRAIALRKVTCHYCPCGTLGS